MKLSFYGFILAIAAFTMYTTPLNAQIHSTTSGGNWGDQATWIGGVVPGASDDVVINGTVDCNGNPSCNNILIEPTGTIRNDYYSGSINITGTITNNGSVQNWQYGFTVYVQGDIINNGSWTNSYTRPNGSGNQTVTSLNGNVFSGSQFHNQKPSGNLYFNGSVNFANCDVFMNDADVYLLANSTFNIHNGQFRNCVLHGSGNTSIVFAEGIYNVDAAVFENIDFYDLVLDGDVKFYTGCSTHGTVYNNGNLQNAWYSTSSDLYGDFINNGTIRNYSSGLTLKIYGNFTNNHVVDNHAMDFYGNSDQTIALLDGKTFSPTYFTSFKPSGSIISNTDLHFDHVTINMDSDALYLPDDGTLTLEGGYLTNTDLNDANNANGYLHLEMIDEAYLTYSTVYNPELLGNADIGDGNTFIGEVLITGSMQNDYYSYSLAIDGNIINNGTIQNNSSALTLNINGDIQNNGIWQNYYTVLNGTTDQHVTCLNGNAFSGSQFISSNSSGSIHFDTEVNFDNVQVLFQGNQVELPLNSKLSLHNGYITQCHIHGNGTTSVLHGEGVYYVDAPFMQDLSFEDLRITGDWGVSYSVQMYGTITNDGILQNAYYSFSVEIYADFINNGTIKNYGGSGLTMQMFNHFTNNGNWGAHAIDLLGTGNQEISLMDGKVFNPTHLGSFKPSGRIVAKSSLSFVNTIINLGTDTLIMPYWGKLSIDGQYMYGGWVMPESGMFNLFMNNGSSLNDIHIHNANLYGMVTCQTVSFYGNTINYGTLRNSYYTYTANFYGHLINHGTIQNYNAAFIVNCYGDITNNGSWTNYFTQMVGGADQYIHLMDGHSIDGQMRFISNAQNGNYQWYWNTWAIVTQFPDPDFFSGYTTETLIFNYPVSSSWLGTFKCWSNGTWSRNIMVDEVSSVRLDITAFLEGPFNGTDMNTDLNSILPLHQSLGILGYNGPEAVYQIPNANVVDWIGIQVCDAPDISQVNESTTVAGGAYFILNNGQIVGLDGSSLPSIDLTPVNNLYVILWHRNHLPVVSYELIESGGIYSYNFTTAASQCYGNNQSDLGGGYFGMIAGNANADGDIDENDGTEQWQPSAGAKGYLQGDVNMDQQVDNRDKNDVWFWNRGKSVIMPQAGFNNCGDVFIDDRDGKAYNTVQIGDQCWMAQNLNTGTMIPGDTDQTDNTEIEKYCYDNYEANCDTYGGLYQWNEVMAYSTTPGSTGICPDGWHVPTTDEWETLLGTVDTQYEATSGEWDQEGWQGYDAGAHLKEAGLNHWTAPNLNATNSSGFTDLPSGGRVSASSYLALGLESSIWTSNKTTPGSTDAFRRGCKFDSMQVSYYYANLNYGFSVRCIKN